MLSAGHSTRSRHRARQTRPTRATHSRRFRAPGLGSARWADRRRALGALGALAPGALAGGGTPTRARGRSGLGALSEAAERRGGALAWGALTPSRGLARSRAQFLVPCWRLARGCVDDRAGGKEGAGAGRRQPLGTRLAGIAGSVGDRERHGEQQPTATRPPPPPASRAGAESGAPTGIFTDRTSTFAHPADKAVAGRADATVIASMAGTAGASEPRPQAHPYRLSVSLFRQRPKNPKIPAVVKPKYQVLGEKEQNERERMRYQRGGLAPDNF